MFFNNKFNTFFGLNLTLVYTFPMCMAWRCHFPIRKYDFNIMYWFDELIVVPLLSTFISLNCHTFLVIVASIAV